MVKSALKKVISQIPLLRYSKGHRIIICYHDISEYDSEHFSPMYSTTIKQFKEHIAYFKKYFVFTDLDAIVEGRGLKKNNNYLSVTFDDGFRSVYDVAFPLLKKSNIPFTLFVNKRAIEEDRLWVSDLFSKIKDNIPAEDLGDRDIKQNEGFDLLLSYNSGFKNFSNNFLNRIYLNKEEVLSLKNAGVSIQNHTLTHPVLSKINNIKQLEEINLNRKYIMDEIGGDVRHFAIPFGKKEHYNDSLINKIKEHHSYIYTTNPNKIRHEKTIIPRIVITTENISQLNFFFNRALMAKLDL